MLKLLAKLSTSGSSTSTPGEELARQLIDEVRPTFYFGEQAQAQITSSVKILTSSSASALEVSTELKEFGQELALNEPTALKANSEDKNDRDCSVQAKGVLEETKGGTLEPTKQVLKPNYAPMWHRESYAGVRILPPGAFKKYKVAHGEKGHSKTFFRCLFVDAATGRECRQVYPKSTRFVVHY